MISEKTNTVKPSSQAPNPERFADFVLSPDRKGFTLKGSDHIFRFDEHGGWLDEFGNYYDANGNPSDPNDWEDGDDDHYGHGGLEDKLMLGYDLDAEEGDDTLHHFDNIYMNAENHRRLGAIDDNTTIEIRFSNVDWSTREQEFTAFLAPSKAKLDDVHFDRKSNGQFSGRCTVKVSHKDDAKKLIELNGKQLNGRNLKIEVHLPGEDDEVDSRPNQVRVPFGFTTSKVPTQSQPVADYKPKPTTQPEVKKDFKKDQHPTQAPSQKVKEQPKPVADKPKEPVHSKTDKPAATSQPQPSKVANPKPAEVKRAPVEDTTPHVPAGLVTTWAADGKLPKPAKKAQVIGKK